MYFLRYMMTVLACAPLCTATTITCTVTDQSGHVVSNSCDARAGTYNAHADLSAGGGPQFWSVYLDAGFSVINDYSAPYKTSVSISGEQSFSIPIVVTGGTGAGALWYSAMSYVGSHYYSSWGVKYGTAGSLGGSASAPCYASGPLDDQNYYNCYVPFTYDVPFMLSGFAKVNGSLSGNMENDSWFFWMTGTLMGIVDSPGKLQATSDEVQIQVLPEPGMLTPLALIGVAFVWRLRAHGSSRNH